MMTPQEQATIWREGKRYRNRFPRRFACTLPIGLLFLLFFGGMESVFAQRAVVLTSSLSMTRQSTRLYAHSIDFSSGTALPGPIRLPGSSITGPLLALPETNSILASSGPGTPALYPEPGYPSSVISILAMAPFDQSAPYWHIATPGFRESAMDAVVCSGTAYAVLLSSEENGKPVGKITLADLGNQDDDTYPSSEIVGHWNIPAIPETAVLLPPRKAEENALPAVMVLYQGNGATPPGFFYCRPGVKDPVRFPTSDFPEWNNAYNKADAFYRHPETGWVYAVFSGRTLTNSTGEPTSLVYAIDPETQKIHPPAIVQGALYDGNAGIHFGGEQGWIAATAPGSDFGYITGIITQKNDSGDWETLQNHAYVVQGVSEGLHLAVDPINGTPAVALGNTLELWPNGERGAWRTTYDEPIRFVTWTREDLLVGEGARVHQVNPITGNVLRTIDLPDGFVAAIIPLPNEYLPAPDTDSDGVTDKEEIKQGTSPDDPDTDHDSIPDGVDPEPTTLSPRLILPSSVTFRSDAAGRELRALPIHCGTWPNASWRVSYVPESMPWLVVHPLSGTGPGIIYLGIDPAHCPRDVQTEGYIQVFMDGVSASRTAADSLANVLIRVLPAPSKAPKILWIFPNDAGAGIRDQKDPRGLKKLADYLAGFPFCFSQEEIWEPVSRDLSAYKIIVISAEALLRGMIPRQMLIDYILQGGSVLIFGDTTFPKESIERLSPWLAPFGLTALPDKAASGSPPSSSQDGWISSWRHLNGQGAFTITSLGLLPISPHTDKMAYARIPDAGPAWFTAFFHGYGRVALIASDTILRNFSDENTPARNAANGLFYWLYQAGLDASDMDTDGLVDRLEDTNNNGGCDPGETNWLEADTDEDGLPDGVEDRNRNGFTDPGETDPRNPDSDDDGLPDGADRTPVSSPVIPTILSITPNSGPADGGDLVLLSGKGLSSDAAFFFNEKPALSVRFVEENLALVQVPEFPMDPGGAVDLRVVNPNTGLQGTLSEGYRYTERRSVNLVITYDKTFPPGNVRFSVKWPDGITRMPVRLTIPSPENHGRWKEARSRSAAQVWINEIGQIEIIGEIRKSSGALETPLAEVTCHWEHETPDALSIGPISGGFTTPSGGRLSLKTTINADTGKHAGN